MSSLRIITPDKLEEEYLDPLKARRLDWTRSVFLSRRRLFIETGSTKLGIIWLILDPLILTCVYLFVFSTIRHNEDPTALFIGLGMIRGMQRTLAVTSNPKIDLTGGLKIDRVSTRAISGSIGLHMATTTLLSGLGVCSVLFILGNTVTGAFFFLVFLLANNLFWYGAGLNLLSLTTRMPDLHKVTSYFGTGMFFFSPVLYTMEATSGWHRTASIYNPMAYFIEASRKMTGREGYTGFDVLPIEGFGIVAIITSLLVFYGNRRLDGIRWRMSDRD